MTPDLRHPRHARVRTGAEYERVFKTGKRAALPAAALHWCRVHPALEETPASDPASEPSMPEGPVRVRRRAHPVPTTARLGLAVSRKVDPDAVGRNRIKRVWRDAFRQVRTQLPIADYVLVARPPCRSLDNAALRALLQTLLQRVGALPLPGAAVTLAAAAPDPVRTASRPTPSDLVPAPASVEPRRP